MEISMKKRLNYGDLQVPEKYFGFVYLTYFPNGKIYIGKTTRRVDEHYFGSGGVKFKKAISEFKRLDICRFVLKFLDNSNDLTRYEKLFCIMFDVTNPEVGYNFFNGECDFSVKNPNNAKIHNEKEVERMLRDNPMFKQENKTKVSENMTGVLNHFHNKHHSEKTKNILRNIFKGIKTNLEPWNKGVNLKEDGRFVERYFKMKIDNPVKTGDEHWTRKRKHTQTDETKEKIRNKAVERLKNSESHKSKIMNNLKQFKVEKELVILALDPAEKFGWALDRNTYGTWNFKLGRDESFSYKLIRFEKKLQEICEFKKVSMVVFERPSGIHAAALMSHAKFLAVIEMYCTKNNIPYKGYSAPEIKKFATGKGNAGKKDMILKAQEELQYKGNDDNEVDALWILELFKAENNRTL